ncbi:GH3 auxin-responsive promoter family protein [Neiella sp. HB171785]|uniref:GH3 auxin-responsive promoter family protein n=1 Tax=Neiella litorisoli TaxID=2771431 RepID=A0A8J6UFP5_9GAMM|nr:GH3 auxin-responsive promoter family protein [Neiella litorisoli]MBD1391169.1 GH3 auxin-responsive promoter family protein [Neiella litorisoli]
MLGLLIHFIASRSAKRFEHTTLNAEQTQRNLLMTILERNKDTEYGKKYDFAAIKSPEQYRQTVPLVSYNDIQPYIDRMCNGEPNQLVAEQPIMFAQTSGTTGKAKFIPFTPSCGRTASKDMMRSWMYHAKLAHPGLYGGKIVSLVSPAIEGETECGLPYGATSGHIYKQMPGIVQKIYAVPYPVFEIEDYEAKYYALMRIALAEKVGLLATANPSSILKMCEKADEYATILINDVKDGTLSNQFNIEPHIRQALEAKLKPAPARAKQLKACYERRNGHLLPGDYWPELALIGCWKGGTVGHYIDKFDTWFNPDGNKPVATRDWGFLSSEARCSVPLSDEGAAGPLALDVNYYEFVDADEVTQNPNDPTAWQYKTVTELEDGGEYYIFLTTTGGLYRYDINDVITVKGFYNQAPKIQFLRKGRGMTNITGEKLSVNQVIDGIQKASEKSGVLAAHFKAEAASEQSRYVLRLEPVGHYPDQQLSSFLQAFDEALQQINIEYKSKRESQRLAPPQLHVMRDGWYERARKDMVSEGKRMFQAKTELLSPMKAATSVIKPELVKVIELD